MEAFINLTVLYDIKITQGKHWEFYLGWNVATLNQYSLPRLNSSVSGISVFVVVYILIEYSGHISIENKSRLWAIFSNNRHTFLD